MSAGGSVLWALAEDAAMARTSAIEAPLADRKA
jgi:hypothetical protein